MRGEWTLRIDDIDPERSQASAADAIRRTLECYGLFWDREIVFQSRNAERYAEALAQLGEASLLYPCTCSRKELASAAADAPYPGFCRDRTLADIRGSHALRLIASNATISFVDRLQGLYSENLATEVGDFVVKRRDGAVAYHLATALDDHDAGVTQVVRGLDLLPSTPRQMYLQQLLNLVQPEYCHVPVLVGADGKKLSKSTRATAVDLKSPGPVLYRLLGWLEQHPPEALARESVSIILDWGIRSWNVDRLSDKTQVIIE